MEIRELLAQTDKLPNVPDVVRELIQQLSDPDADYGEIAEKVTQDQTLSMRILRLVNSAYFGLNRKLASIDEAVVMIGMARLKTMVIASGLAGSVQEVEGLDLRQFWSEAFRVAAAAKWFAEKSELVDADTAFTAGLVHNIGRLLLHLTQPKLAQAIQVRVEESGGSRSEAEIERLGFRSVEVGQALLDYWKFPAEIGEAVRYFKWPLEASDAQPLAAVVNLACVVNAVVRDGKGLEHIREDIPLEFLELAGVPDGVMEELDVALELDSGLEGLLA